jgi:hypothetical protein
MTKLILTNEQARVLAESNGQDAVLLFDPSGKHLGWVERPAFTPEEVAEAERALDEGGLRYTTEEVLAHLRSLAPE